MPYEVALHGIEPATVEHCALIRDWLDDLGVGHVTLMVGSLGHSYALRAWLDERRADGDVVVPDDGTRAPLRSLALGAAARVDLHPEDFDRHPARTRLLERTLRRAAQSGRLRADLQGVQRAA